MAQSNNRKRKRQQDKRHRARCQKRNQNAKKQQKLLALAKHGRTKDERKETTLVKPKMLLLNPDIFVMKYERKVA